MSDRVVTLQAPLGTEAALAVVRTFFASVLEESTTTLGAVVAADAVIQHLPEPGTAGPSGATRAQEALGFWARRFRQRDYGRLAEEVVYRESDVAIFRAGLVDRVPSRLQSVAPEQLEQMAETDLVLQVPIVTTSIRSERLFGDEIYFWLKRTGDSYIIYHLAEPFPF